MLLTQFVTNFWFCLSILPVIWKFSFFSVYKHFHFRFISGASGKVSIDHVGDRHSALVVKNVQNGRYKRTANFFTGRNLLRVLNDTVVIWPGKTTKVPVGRPECGFNQEFCPPDPATGKYEVFVKIDKKIDR